MITNARWRYGWVSRLIHWLTALIVIVMLSYGFFMVDLNGPIKATVFMLHKSFGLVVLLLLVCRLAWLAIAGTPLLPRTMTRFHKILSRLGYAFLYGLLLLMPFSGLIMSVASQRYPVFFNIYEITLPWIPREKALAGFMQRSHLVLAWVFIAALVTHLLAMLRHYFICRDGIFERMVFGRGPKR